MPVCTAWQTDIVLLKFQDTDRLRRLAVSFCMFTWSKVVLSTVLYAVDSIKRSKTVRVENFYCLNPTATRTEVVDLCLRSPTWKTLSITCCLSSGTESLSSIFTTRQSMETKWYELPKWRGLLALLMGNECRPFSYRMYVSEPDWKGCHMNNELKASWPKMLNMKHCMAVWTDEFKVATGFDIFFNHVSSKLWIFWLWKLSFSTLHMKLSDKRQRKCQLREKFAKLDVRKIMKVMSSLRLHYIYMSPQHSVLQHVENISPIDRSAQVTLVEEHHDGSVPSHSGRDVARQHHTASCYGRHLNGWACEAE